MRGLRQSFRPNGPSREPFHSFPGSDDGLDPRRARTSTLSAAAMNMVGQPLFFLSLVQSRIKGGGGGAIVPGPSDQ